jgi:hypothetical protein
MEPHRRFLGALSPLVLGAVFVVAFAVATDVSQGADANGSTEQVLFTSGFSDVDGWKPRRARVRVLEAGDAAALVTARRRRGVFALALRPGPPAATIAGDEYSAWAKLRSRQAQRRICLVLQEQAAGETLGRTARCRLVGRRWTTLSASGYTALEDGNRIVLDIYSVARRTTTRANRFVVSSAKLTQKCKAAAAACGGSSGGNTTGTSTDVTTTTEVAPTPPSNNPVPAPATGVLFGAKPGYYQSDVSAFESLVGRKLDIRQVFYDWSKAWPDSRAGDDDAHGRIPLISWKGTNLAGITSGSYDALIRDRARAVKNLGFPIFVRWAHEMNASWYPWGRQPTAYVTAWRRIHAIFEQEGATNVAWVWSPSIPQGDWDAYYPGDAYVDWIAGDNYNWGSCRDSWSSWRPFSSMFLAYHDHFGGRKPMMIAEVGSAEQGGSKSAWLAEAEAAIKTMPAYHAWIHQEYVDGACDWRVSSSESALAAYRDLASDPYFKTR